MNFGELLWWYLGNARDYAAQMLPCMCAGMAVYALALPVRRRRLDRMGLVSPRRRELALLLFVMFAAGLAALTLFPAGFWRRAHWLAALRGERPLISPLGRPPPHFAAGTPAGDPPGGAGAVGHVSGGGQRGHLFAGGIFPRPAGTKAPVVEGAGNGADRLGDHRDHSIFHRPQRRRGRRAAEHRRGPGGLWAVLPGPGPVSPADRRISMPNKR